MSILTAYNKFIQQALKYGFSLWGLPKTGQITVYRTGDDGDKQKGYPKSGARFTDNGNGTITDNATGLMWVKDPSQLGGAWGTPGSPSKMNWNDAIDNCNSLNYAGHSDWRLPNTIESLSITKNEGAPPQIDTTYFPNSQSLPYWTSSRFYYSSGMALILDLAVCGISAGLKTSEYHVRPVRLGIPKD